MKVILIDYLVHILRLLGCGQNVISLKCVCVDKKVLYFVSKLFLFIVL